MAKPHRLLIVEDEPNTSTMLQQFFSLRGYEVRVTAWGHEAIAQCQTDPPDLIVLDVRLPDMEGYEVYARLRQLFHTRHLPVIFLTERRSRNDKITGLQLGAIDYMTKPFDPEELALRVHNVLRRVEQSKMVNAVTSLPIGRKMEEQLRLLAGQGEWAALHIRVDNLGPFSQTYGDLAGEEVLRTVADTLCEVVDELGSSKDFVGHLSEADFVLMTSPARAETLQKEIVSRLPRVLRAFATPNHAGDTNGDPTRPSLSVAIGLLTSADLPPDDDQSIGHRLAGGDVPLTPLPLDS